MTASIIVPARTGLAGHPSDAFGGAVLAAPVPELAATVTIEPADDVAVGDRRFPDLDAVVAAEHRGPSRLLTASVARLVSWLRERGEPPPAGGFALTWHTTIPRSVGLAGSSALVIGALRAVAGGWDVTLSDDDGPRLALEVEADLLGIAAGPQDRIVQWHGSTVLMDFGRDPWRVEPVQPPSPLDLFVCWTDAGRRSSDATHAPLQQRRDDPDVRTRMAALAGLAHEAAAALRVGDVATLGTCLDAGFRLRRELVPLEPAHVALVDALRALGAAVNYTGSGGAVVALAPAVEPLERWAAAQRLGWCTTRLG